MSIVFYAPRDTKAGICFSNYSPELVAKYPDFIFVFGDNLVRFGTAGQACIRNEPNALGVATKRFPDTTPDSYMTGTPEEFEKVKMGLENVQRHLSEGRTVIFPSTGLGTGLARLETTAPSLLAYIDSEVSKLIHADYKLIREHKR